MSSSSHALESSGTVAAGSAGPEASADALGCALAGLGVRVTVQARGRAAFLRALDDGTAALLRDAALRRRVVALGRTLGFTHVALVLEDG